MKDGLALQVPMAALLWGACRRPDPHKLLRQSGQGSYAGGTTQLLAPCGLSKLRAASAGPPTRQGKLTMEPMAPLPAVGMKAMSATSALRTLQEGCQCSGWYEDMDRQILTPTSKRPLGDSIMKLQGGRAEKVTQLQEAMVLRT